jgi:hypothetical protein
VDTTPPEGRWAMPAAEVIRQYIGREIDIDRRDGGHHRGTLLNATRRSLWLVDGDEDCFIELVEIEDLRAAS